MSRLTATQVIERGDYLEPDFDPTMLTVPHLLSVLTFHGVKYPTPHNKSKLVQLFNEEIKPRSARFKKERLQRESSIASSEGITDGLTGRSLNDPPPRRSSRRLSRPSSQTPPSAKPDPPKRRRSSAGPSLSRTPSKVEQHEPTLQEESEPEEEPVKKVGRPRRSVVAAGPQARRVSRTEDVEGWSDNNIFQSGAESSSPARSSPNVKVSASVRRPTRRGRISLSAPPQMPSSSPSALPTSPTFDPRIGVMANLPSQNLRTREHIGTSDALGNASRRLIPKVEQRSSSPLLEEEEDQEEQEWEHSEGDENSGDVTSVIKFNADVSKTISNGGSVHPRAHRDTLESRRLSVWARAALILGALALGGLTRSYQTDSASIGYCHPGTNTNAVLGERQVALIAAQECSEQLAQQSNADQDALNISCTPLPLIPLPRPMTCTPCPAHAYCTPHTVTCEQSFVLRQHLLIHIPFLPQLLNGMPGLGPIAFPPSCVEDEERRKNIGRLGVALEHYLALARGQRLCIGASSSGDSEAVQWGLDIDQVHDHLKKVTVIQKKAVKEAEFESLFDQAVTDLQRYGYVIMGRDMSGARYIAAVRTHMDFACRLRVGCRDLWDQWKAYALVSVLLLASAYWTKGKIASRQMESRRVGELVQVVLDTLRNQEIAYHTDPVTAPRPYLSSLHLRDLILQDEHSIPARRRLWDKVERVVEGNTNVRAGIEELEGGDEARVWKWVGGTNRKSIVSQ